MKLNGSDLELELLIKAIYEVYGIDFSHYKKNSLKRRVSVFQERKGLTKISELIPLIIYNQNEFESLIQDISVPVTEMFRDPSCYSRLRVSVLPELKKNTNLRIWIAGCASGEEAYSLAIMLHENNIHSFSIIATDMNRKAVHIAEQGLYPEELLTNSIDNYIKSGGKFHLEDYFQSTNISGLKIKKDLLQNIEFRIHNMIKDEPIKDVQLIICRNVFIYFDQELQSQLVKMFAHSLIEPGFLWLGKKESLAHLSQQSLFKEVDEDARIYQKAII